MAPGAIYPIQSTVSVSTNVMMPPCQHIPFLRLTTFFLRVRKCESRAVGRQVGREVGRSVGRSVGR